MPCSAVSRRKQSWPGESTKSRGQSSSRAREREWRDQHCSAVHQTATVRCVRRVSFRNRDGTADGGVHGLFTITGRSDSGGCSLAQPDFIRELGNRNVSFRIPTPTFRTWGWWKRLRMRCFETTLLRINVSSQRSAYVVNSTPTAMTELLLALDGRHRISLCCSLPGRHITSNKAFRTNCSRTNVMSHQNCTLEWFARGHHSHGGKRNGRASLFRLGRASRCSCAFSLPRIQGLPPRPVQNGANLFNAVGCALCHTTTLTSGKARYRPCRT